MQDLYKQNADFRDFVNKYCKCNNVTVEEALEHKLVQEVGKQYADGGEDNNHCEFIRSEGYDYKATVN